MKDSPYLPRSPYAPTPGVEGARDADSSSERGGVLKCRGCAYVFVGKNAAQEEASCERCGGDDVAPWKP